MSATNRGARRRKSDNYRTPYRLIEEFFDAFGNLFPTYSLEWINLGKNFRVLDPGVGGTKVIPGPYPKVIKCLYPKAQVTSIDIRPTASADHVCDFRKFSERRKYQLVITNPPYSLAQEFIDHSLELVVPGGLVVMLLRINFLGAQCRKEWWQTRIPNAILLHSNRPSFTHGGTDATEYAHFIWCQGVPATSTLLRVI